MVATTTTLAAIMNTTPAVAVAAEVVPAASVVKDRSAVVGVAAVAAKLLAHELDEEEEPVKPTAFRRAALPAVVVELTREVVDAPRRDLPTCGRTI